MAQVKLEGFSVTSVMPVWDIFVTIHGFFVRLRPIWTKEAVITMNNHSMVEVVLPNQEMFLVLKETLTRIGLPNREQTKLFQTCHILCKKKKYFIVHFKEMFMLDGRPSSMTDTDTARRNSVINYLLDRKFFTLVSGATKLEPSLPHTAKNDDFTIITHAQKKKWELVPKYVIGNPANKKRTLKKKEEPPKEEAVAATADAALTIAEPVLS